MRQNMFALPETGEIANRKMGSRDRELREPSKLFNPYRNVLYPPIAKLASIVEENPLRSMRKIRLLGKWLELRVSGRAAITRYLNQR